MLLAAGLTLDESLVVLLHGQTTEAVSGLATWKHLGQIKVHVVN